jgi:protein O-GlcNAc transferase
MSPLDFLAIAVQHHQAGRLQAAEQIYRQILEIDPANAQVYYLLGALCQSAGKLNEAAANLQQAVLLNPNQAEALNHLGVVRRQQGKLDEAAACYRRALELKPDYAEAYNNLGAALNLPGKLDEAVVCCRRALDLKPDYAEAHNNLGAALQHQGKLDEAAACYRRALELKPDYAMAHTNLGNTMQLQGKLNEAAACHRRALELKPDYAVAHNSLGAAMQLQGKLDEAAACFRRALELKPDYARAHNNLGAALQLQGKLDEAVTCYRRAAELKPDHAEAHYNLGAALQIQGNPDDAAVCFRRALELKPDYADAHNNLGAALQLQGKLDEAAACYRRAAELKPDYVEAHCNLGNTLQHQGKLDDAAACYRRALEINPNYPAALVALAHQYQHTCQWTCLAPASRQAIDAVIHPPDNRRLIDTGSPFSFQALPTPTTAQQQLQCASQWVQGRLTGVVELGARLRLSQAHVPRSKITLGYLSADFHAHATAHLIAELIEKHDRRRFNVLGYSYGADDHSPMRQRLMKAFDSFVDVRPMSNPEAARNIAADRVNIVIDLKGYTQDCRTAIVALRPAPIQVNYLGYPGTMGAAFMDYILVDDFVVPSDQQPFFTEKLVHLPGCYQVNDSRREISPETPTRAKSALPETGFVFCCFNGSYKITPEVFSVWMELLKEVPGSLLWLLEANRFAPANLRREAEARGVAAQRLVFAPRCPLPEHLARHRLADLFLDTFPVNAHTAASDALWAGCPVLTIAGETFVSRVAGSLLRTLGLPELVTASLKDYQAMALRLARNAELLGEVRARLEANRKTSPLFDAAWFARNLEKAYLTMWEIYASGEKPRAFAVSAT